VVVDDAESGVSDVVRGADLVASTPRQVWLARVLGYEPRRYAHVPLVLAEDGARLEKRARGASLRELRQKGVSAERVIGELAFGLGLSETNAPASTRAIAAAPGARAIGWRKDPWRIPGSLVPW
jgi:glutamyl-tRNA synthetase